MNYIGDFAEDSTIRIAFTTNNASGAAVAPSTAFEADDFRIYKNGSASQKTTTNGVTITSPFDSVTGLHTLTIDTSNDTGDTGFWTTGADYWIIAVPDETVDSQTVVQVVAAFSIQNRYMRGTDGANTTTPPTAAANASQVRTELTTELNRIDASISSRLAAAGYTAPPSASSNATAVRSELTTELARIDVAISTRLASASYTAPDNASVTAIKAKTDNLPGDPADASDITAAFTEIKGVAWSSTTDTLEAIRDAAGSGSTSIMVTPVVAQVPVRVRDTDIETYIGDLSTIRIGIFSGEDAVDLLGFGNLEVCVQAKDGTDLDFVPMADLTIDGTSNNYVSWEPSGPSVATVRRGKWSLRKTSNKQVIAKGAWIISDAALEDTGS